MTTPEGITPPPESHLVKTARTALRPRVSMTEAAERAGVAKTQWRYAEKGWGWAKKGVPEERAATPETLAKIARYLEITPSELKNVGRDDAAEELEYLTRDKGELPTPVPLSEVPSEDLLSEIGRRLSVENANLSYVEPDPPLRLVARQVDPEDPSTFGGDD